MNIASASGSEDAQTNNWYWPRVHPRPLPIQPGFIKQEKTIMKTSKTVLTMSYLAAVCAFLLFFASHLSAQKHPAGAHTPSAGSAERKTITDGLRGEQKVVYKIHYLKVHGDWA